MPDLNITVNGTPLSFIGYWGQPVVTHRDTGGSWELTWQMDLPVNFRHPDLVVGAQVVAYDGPSRIWRGFLTEPDMDSLEFVAFGSARQGEAALATNLTGATDLPGDAVFFAESRGAIDWGSLETFTAAKVDTSQGPLSISALLDAYAADIGKKWIVSEDGLLYTTADPTVPRWQVTPGAGVLGVADEDFWTQITALYSPSIGTYSTVTTPPSNTGHVRERAIDLTGRGLLSSAQAQAIVNNLLAQGGARTGWSNGIEVAHGQVLSMGGSPAALSLVRAGHMVELNELYDERGNSASTQIILSETVWNVAEGTLQMSPQGLAARDLSSIVEAAGGSLK